MFLVTFLNWPLLPQYGWERFQQSSQDKVLRRLWQRMDVMFFLRDCALNSHLSPRHGPDQYCSLCGVVVNLFFSLGVSDQWEHKVLHWPLCTLWHLSVGGWKILSPVSRSTPASSCFVFQVEVCLWAVCAAGVGLGWSALSHLPLFSKWPQNFPGLSSYSLLCVITITIMSMLQHKGKDHLWQNTSYLHSLTASDIV